MQITHDVEHRVDELTGRLLAEHLGEQTRDFLGAQFDAGLAFVWFPEGHGGLGASPALQRTVNQRIVEAGGPIPPLGIGHGMAAPTIAAHGTDEQRRHWLRPLFTGEEVWCQLFSEPGAGSDVASLATTAIRTATSGSSTVRRCGRASPISRAGDCSSRAPIPTSRSTGA